MIRFTDTYIKNLKPKEKRDEKYEGGGFGIFIYPSGSKTWIYRYKIDNKKDYIIMGHYPSMNLADARKTFHELRELRRSGQNPKQMMRQQKMQSDGNQIQSKFGISKYVTLHTSAMTV